MLNSFIKINKKYYPETLLEECKYKIRKKMMINDDLDSNSSDESDKESDNESVNESDIDFYNESDNDESND